MAGADLMVQRALDYLEQELGPYIAEFDPRRTPGAPGAYYVPNRSFDLADGAVAWAMIRRHRPRRVLELGSGFSTLLIRDALKRNGPGSIHVVVDPSPSTPELLRCADFDLKTISAGDLPGSEFDELAENDVLFIDTTHTVKVGGEVNEVFLERFPRLSSGVLVHVHDVFLPYEYPREFVEGLHYYWAEQYLLQAFLAFNSEFETLVPNHFLLTDHASEVRDLFPSGAVAGSSFWFRRK
jgi:predicted O-methyltransferase YrrM